MASIAPGGELLVVTASAVDPVAFGPELFVDKGLPAGGAEETGLVPVLILIGQVLKQTQLYRKVAF